MATRNTNEKITLGAAGRQEEEQPVYVQLIAKLSGTIKKLGLDVEDKAGWVKIEHPQTHHKVYIRRSMATLPRIESTLPSSAPGARPTDKDNGRITSLLDPDPELLAKSLASMSEEELPPDRRGARWDDNGVDDEEPPVRRRRTSNLEELLAGRKGKQEDPTAQVRALAQPRRKRSSTRRPSFSH